MPGERKYYVFSDDNCKFETMTKTQILQAISKAVNIGVVEEIQAADGIIEKNKGKLIQLWVGTQSEYNNIAVKESNVLYIISDDTSKDDLIAKLDDISERVNALNIQGIDVFNSAAEMYQAQIGIEQSVSEVSGLVADVEAEVIEYESAVAREQTELQFAYQAKQNAGNLERQIAGGTQEVLFNDTVKFDQPKTLTMEASVEYYNKIAINIKYNSLLYSHEIYMQYLGTEKFLIRQDVEYGDVIYRIMIFCKFEDNKFIIDEVRSEETIKNIDLDLSIYGIV